MVDKHGALFYSMSCSRSMQLVSELASTCPASLQAVALTCTDSFAPDRRACIKSLPALYSRRSKSMTYNVDEIKRLIKDHSASVVGGSGPAGGGGGGGGPDAARGGGGLAFSFLDDDGGGGGSAFPSPVDASAVPGRGQIASSGPGHVETRFDFPRSSYEGGSKKDKATAANAASSSSSASSPTSAPDYENLKAQRDRELNNWTAQAARGSMGPPPPPTSSPDP